MEEGTRRKETKQKRNEAGVRMDRRDVAAQSAMHPSTKLMAFLDDVHVVTTPPRVADSNAHLDRALWEHAGIRINQARRRSSTGQASSLQDASTFCELGDS